MQTWGHPRWHSSATSYIYSWHSVNRDLWTCGIIRCLLLGRVSVELAPRESTPPVPKEGGCDQAHQLYKLGLVPYRKLLGGSFQKILLNFYFVNLYSCHIFGVSYELVLKQFNDKPAGMTTDISIPFGWLWQGFILFQSVCSFEEKLWPT